jgi:hypothetical protein
MTGIHFLRLGRLAVVVFLLATPALAQTSPNSYSDVPDQFRLELGGFRIGAQTDLVYNKNGVPQPPVDFESLKVPANTTQFYVEGFWRPWRRHQFSLSWYRNSRDGSPVTVQRDFTWGDRVVNAGATVTGTVRSTYVSGAYRFAAYKNDRFEIGPALGIGHLSVDAGIGGTATATGAAGSASGPFDISTKTGSITGDVGGYFYWWAVRRLLIRGEGRYIYVSPDNSKASITDFRTSAIYHPWRKVGLGLQYVYTKFRYDRDILSSELGGHLRYQGGQVILTTAF